MKQTVSLSHFEQGEVSIGDDVFCDYGYTERWFTTILDSDGKGEYLVVGNDGCTHWVGRDSIRPNTQKNTSLALIGL